MNQWLKTKLGLLVDTKSETFKFTDSPVIFLNTSDIYNNKIQNFDYSFPKNLPGQAKKRIKNNDLLFSEIRPANKRFAIVNLLNPEEFVVSTKLMVLRCGSYIEIEFLRYFLTSDEQLEYLQMLAEDRSGTFPQITFDTIAKLDINLPPKNEQKAIISVLSSLDDKIDLLHHQNKTLESMAETLFRQWFIEGAQEDWHTTTLDYHITVAKGLSYKGAGLTTSDNGIPLFSLNSVLEGGGYKSAGLKYYNGDFKERHVVKAGDIIVANTEQGHEYRLIGYPAIIPATESESSIYTHHLFKVSINDDSYLTNSFVYYLLCSKNMHEQVVTATNGSTVNQLSADGLQRPAFKLPPENIVKDFTTHIYFFWKKINRNNAQVKTLENLRDTLLPKLMSGEVRVQYAKEAIASVA